MKKIIRNRIIVVGLIALFAIPYTIQSLHVSHEYCSLEEHSEGEDHDCTHCPVCKFVLSTFTEVELPELQFTKTLIDIVSYPASADTYLVNPFPYYLRGPPQV